MFFCSVKITKIFDLFPTYFVYEVFSKSVVSTVPNFKASLEGLSSPMILNGSGYGLFANHSLVMANYLARANAAVITLRDLLDQG